MANTYSWTIRGLSYEIGPDSEGHSDVVNSVDWLLTASDGEDPPHEALWSGVAKVAWEEGDDWIAYGDLVESDVVGWVESSLGDELASMKSQLDAQIEDEVNPTEGSAGAGDMPWSPDEPEESDEDDGG